jgi:uncharacterized protein with PIN domain
MTKVDAMMVTYINFRKTIMLRKDLKKNIVERIEIYNILRLFLKLFMVKEVLPSCNICGIPVADLVEPEVSKEGQIKQGKYVDNIWICNDCLNK